MDKKRYMLIIVGNSTGVSEDIKNFADEEGAYFVDGKGVFLSTYHSDFNINEQMEFLIHRPATMVFDITEEQNFHVNLPKKYYLALFPEVEDMLEKMSKNIQTKKETKRPTKVKIEEYYNVDDILDKLSRNNYDRKCLTKTEVRILEEGQ